ncbi:pilus assembly protein TadG-related protein [Nocardioides hwasunensis]|uniref:Putative Flp pilus-assembly TadG-like N-terminal domain-containing protein n=1 Tax=Nocardioides hwasunensis TaxID=397258 RepID=A0ABR8MDA6_9ACTN|nr:pilus assembly protein TadG-related protein [Nocardioides hwasunensis]MBD3913937.1 hypothetical protein [Nocardioides hwasunensis]
MRTADVGRRARALARRLPGRDEVGAIALVVALFFAVVALPLSAITVDLARMYVQIQRVQAAADAAATAGVTYMPDDFAAAKARAIEIAEDNGFRNSGTSAVAVAVGDKPTQLKVTVSSTIKNAFGRSLGIPDSTLSRSAVADFNGPAPLGSPCNTFGNEPPGSSILTPVGSTLKPVTYATCSTNPQFWGAMAGPETFKDQGSQFEARKCSGVEIDCASSAVGALNNEFDARGYVYLVRITPAAVNQSVRLQIFDPAYVDTGSGSCNAGPVSSSINATTNSAYPYATTDASTRYQNGATAFCTGDSDNSGKRFPTANNTSTTTEVPTITSFALRTPVDTLNPYAAPVHSAGCVKQYPGYSNTSGSGALTTNNLRTGTSSTYRPEIAKVYRQWVDFCTFTPTKAGDYYLQVRTNVALPTSYSLDSTGAVMGNMAVVNQTGDDLSVKGNGNNMFAIRAISGAPSGAVSVASWERMRIYANADSATTTFNLVRVAPAAASKTLVITYYDVGEAANTTSGSVQVLAPADSNISPTAVANCKGEGVHVGTLANCKVPNVTSATNNGKTQTVRVPIPSSYTCQITSTGGCWWRVTINFPNSTVTDATTWTARIVGEPVRLIE